MKILVDGEKKSYSGKLMKEVVGKRFPKGSYLQRLLRLYPSDETEFSSIFLKLYQVPPGYKTVYTLGGKKVGNEPTRGSGYRFMIGLAGLAQSAYVVNTGIQNERLATQDILTLDNVLLRNIDFQVFYRLKEPEKALDENVLDDYRSLVFAVAEKRVNNYVGNNTLESLIEVEKIPQKDSKGRLITDEIYQTDEEGNIKTDQDGNYIKTVVPKMKLNWKKRNLIFDEIGNPEEFPTLNNIGVELIDLFILDNPIDDDTKNLILGRVIGRAERYKRMENADAEAYEITKRGTAVAEAGRAIQNIPGAMVLSTLEVYQDFAQGPNNTFVTMPELKVNLSPQTDFSPRPDNMPGGPIYQPPVEDNDFEADDSAKKEK